MASLAVISARIRGQCVILPIVDSILYVLSRLYRTSDYIVSVRESVELSTYFILPADESLGQLMIVAGNKTQLETIRSQFESMLLDHGRQCSSTLASRVVTKILNDQRLHRDW